MPRVMTPTLECTRCERSLPLDRFPTSLSKGRRYVRRWCAECLRSYFTLRVLAKRALKAGPR